MKPLIVANWKMNPLSLAEAKKLFDSVKRGVKNIKKAEVVICPPFLYLNELSSSRPARSLARLIRIGAQNCFYEKEGAYTGEVSPAMLKDLGCKYVIVGHSERRKYFKETDEQVNKKLKAALKAGLTPILCISDQKEIPYGLNKKTIIAYEPIWAIGSGKACDVEEAQKMRILIRKIAGKDIRVLYGGSVNSKNASDYIKEAGFQGLLVGGASLKAEEFNRICFFS